MDRKKCGEVINIGVLVNTFGNGEKGEDHLPLDIFKIYSMDVEKPIQVGKLPPLMFVYGPKK